MPCARHPHPLARVCSRDACRWAPCPTPMPARGDLPAPIASFAISTAVPAKVRRAANERWARRAQHRDGQGLRPQLLPADVAGRVPSRPRGRAHGPFAMRSTRGTPRGARRRQAPCGKRRLHSHVFVCPADLCSEMVQCSIARARTNARVVVETSMPRLGFRLPGGQALRPVATSVVETG
jgi:hypothetical protein